MRRIGENGTARMATGGSQLSFVRRLLVSEITAVLLAGGYLGLCLSGDNRLFMYFGWVDTAALLMLVGGAGLAAALVLHAGSRATRGRSDKWLSPCFFFAVVMIGFNFFPTLRQAWVKHLPWLSGTVYYLMIWGLGGVLTWAGYRWSGMRKLAAAGWRRSALLWPLLILLPFNLLAAKKWEGGQGGAVQLERRAQGAAAPVVVLILDMIGYGDAFTPEGAVFETLPNLASFSSSAMVFHQARSCGDFTSTSLPGLMLQEEVGNPLLENDGVRWRVQASAGGPPRLAKDFAMALPYRFREAGGRAVYFGYYLPYKEIMPGAWDEVVSPCFYGLPRSRFGTGLWAALWHHVVQYWIASKDPVAGWAKQIDLYTPWLNDYHRELTGDVLEAGKRYIRDSLSPGDLAIIHLTVPHPPIVFNAEGGPSRYGREDPAGYADQLYYADRLFGELVGELKQAGQWESAWVVVMSDHGSHFQDWSSDPEEKRHVPFMVKAPGQTERQDLQEPIRLADFEQIPGFPLAPATGKE